MFVKQEGDINNVYVEEYMYLLSYWYVRDWKFMEMGFIYCILKNKNYQFVLIYYFFLFLFFIKLVEVFDLSVEDKIIKDSGQCFFFGCFFVFFLYLFNI